MNQKANELANHLKQLVAGPMTMEEIDFLRDVQGMIDFSIRNGINFAVVVGAVLHDLIEIRQAGGDLNKAKARGFLPQVTGYAKISADSFGESEEDAAVTQ